MSLIVISSIIHGVGNACGGATMWAMVSDTIDYGEWKTGIRTEGLVNSACSFGYKIGNGIGLALLGLILEIGGYAGEAAVQTASALASIKICFVWIPMGVYAAGLVIMAFYHLVLTDDETVDLKKLPSAKGIWAPCLTYCEQEDLFYAVYGVMNSMNARYFDVDNYVITVREVFDNTFAGWLDSREYPNEDFSEALLAGDLEAVNRILNDVLVSSISYYDGGTRPSGFRLPENFYHGLVLGLIASLRGLYAVTSNRESGFGRYDVMLEPLKSGYDAMILEFKVYDGEGRGLDAAVDAALRQIIEKDYAALPEAKGISKERIRIYGFAFEGKTVLAGGGGRIETINRKL